MLRRLAATNRQPTAPNRNSAKIMSKIAIDDSANVAGIDANISEPSAPTSSPNSSAPTQRVIAKRPIAESALGSRAANSVSPSSSTDAPWSQWKRTGLSMNGLPSRSGTSQLPECSISRVSSCVVSLIRIQETGIAEAAKDNDPGDRHPGEGGGPPSRHTAPRHA